MSVPSNYCGRDLRILLGQAVVQPQEKNAAVTFPPAKNQISKVFVRREENGLFTPSQFQHIGILHSRLKLGHIEYMMPISP